MKTESQGAGVEGRGPRGAAVGAGAFGGTWRSEGPVKNTCGLVERHLGPESYYQVPQSGMTSCVVLLPTYLYTQYRGLPELGIPLEFEGTFPGGHRDD